MILEIGNRERCASVSIPWLPDRTGIQHVSRARLDSEWRKQIAAARLEVKRIHFFVSQSETALKMRVPEEGHSRRSIQKAGDRLSRSKHIFVLIVNRAVHHVKA